MFFKKEDSSIYKSKFILRYKKFLSNLHIQKYIKSKFYIIDDDVKREMIEETAGNLSSTAIIGVFALAGGGIAIFAHPLAGSIIMVISIFYGSCAKVYAGKYYKQKIKNINNKSVEVQLLEALNDSNKNLIPYIRTNTSKYAFIRIGRESGSMLNKIKLPSILTPKSSRIIPFSP